MVGLGGGLLLGAAAEATGGSVAAPAFCYRNSDFYDPAGKFNQEAAKAIYLKFLALANYPISDNLRQNLWVTDFGLGRFTEIGLAGVFWVNNKKDNYTSLEMLLLPNQMVPEHWHVALPAEGVAAKMESWHVRWGSTFTYGEGEPTAKLAVAIPAGEEKYITVRREKELRLGEVTGISRPEEKHWQMAGFQGAIITETSTYHTSAAVRFTNPNIKF
jgi:D-lyxose ketol-isomerase